METNEDRRRRKLEALIKHHGAETVASEAGLSAAYLNQIVKRVLLPKKADGTRSPRALADDAARRIERGLGLATGWMDWPFDGFDLVAYYSLTAKEQGELEAKMRDVAKEILAQRSKPLAA